MKTSALQYQGNVETESASQMTTAQMKLQIMDHIVALDGDIAEQDLNTAFRIPKMTALVIRTAQKTRLGVAMKDFVLLDPRNVMMENAPQIWIVNLGSAAQFGDIVEQTLHTAQQPQQRLQLHNGKMNATPWQTAHLVSPGAAMIIFALDIHLSVEMENANQTQIAQLLTLAALTGDIVEKIPNTAIKKSLTVLSAWTIILCCMPK